MVSLDTLRGVFSAEALVPLGRAVVLSAIRVRLARERRAEERALPLVELVNRQITDSLARRKVNREIGRMVDSVAERLRP